MADKRIEPCGVRCPPARDPLGLSKVVSGTGVSSQQVVSGGVVAPGHDMLVGQRNIDVFWESMPWSDGQTYFSRVASVPINMLGVAQIDAFPVPRGSVLAITSVVFRMKVQLNLVIPQQYVYLRDDFLLSDATIADEAAGLFYPLINSQAMVNRMSVNNATGTQRAGYYLLNTSIQTSEVPFIIFAKEGATVQTNFECFALFLQLTNTGQVGVDYEGIWMSKKQYDSLRQRFNVNR